MALEVRKRQGETGTALLYRFTRKVKKSGVLTEVKGRRFYSRPTNKNKRRKSAFYREEKREALAKERKFGTV